MKRLKLLTVFATLISIQTVSSHLQRTGQAKSETIDKQYSKLVEYNNKAFEVCREEFTRAEYLAISPKEWETDPDHISSAQLIRPLSGTSKYRIEKIQEYKYFATPKGILGVNGKVVKQASGKDKCDRGIIDKPLPIGKEVTRKGIKQLVKIENCFTDQSCLKYYEQNSNGKITSSIIGVHISGVEKKLPYSERSVYSHTTGVKITYKIHLGPPELKCYTYSGIGDSTYLMDKYKRCLQDYVAQNPRLR